MKIYKSDPYSSRKIAEDRLKLLNPYSKKIGKNKWISHSGKIMWIDSQNRIVENYGK